MPKVSIIIPCYNHGRFVDDAIDSITDQSFQDYEIIVVNDGSTDEYTNTVLSDYRRPKTRVIHTSNNGLAGARNVGIANASGEYILPLDADDKIGRDYIGKAVELLDADPELGIVYGDAEFFGERTGKWNLPKYSFELMLAVNTIYCSGVFRKKDWEKAGGYSRNMKYGYEDWNFWLSILELGRKVHKIPKICFYYRITKSSMSKTIPILKKSKMYLQVYCNHKRLYLTNFPRFIKGCFLFVKAESYRQ